MQKVIPGQRLGASNEKPSTGTYERDNSVYASLVGYKQTLAGKISVQRAIEAKTAIPAIGDMVIGRIIRINQRFATMSILVVGNLSVAEPFQGIIRCQDIRSTDRDKVKVYKSCRPGDIVRAKVISLGDARSYYLSTAENSLGVILATSSAGATMIPISWEEMICPKTKMREFRKCAKPEESR